MRKLLLLLASLAFLLALTIPSASAQCGYSRSYGGYGGYYGGYSGYGYHRPYYYRDYRPRYRQPVVYYDYGYYGGCR